MRFKRLGSAGVAMGTSLVWASTSVRAGITADSLIGTYIPGDLADSGDTPWENPSAALGPLAGDTLQGYGAMNPFNPAFAPSQIVGIGPGGELSLHLSSAIPIASAPTLGVFSNNGLVDVSYDGAGVAGTPATTFDDPDHPSAVVSVSADGIHFVALNGGNPIVFSNPANYYTDQSITNDYEPTGKAIADQFQPFTGNLSSFGGENFSQIKAQLNESAGGTWLSLAGTGLTSVIAVRFDVPSAADFPMFVDSLAGVSTQSNDIWNNTAGTSGATGDGATWDTVQPNWNNGTPAAAYNDYTYPAMLGDNVTFNDDNAGNYSVCIPGIVHPASIVVDNSRSSYTFTNSGNRSGGIAGSTGLTKLGAASLILATSNSFTGPTNVSGGTLLLASAGALPGGTNLSIAAQAVVVAENLATVLTVASLGIAGTVNGWTGKLDLGDNELIVENGSLATVTDQLAQGFNGGRWNGSGGITSSAAASDALALHALGVIQTGNDVQVKYTDYGDANLDGIVDGSDYSRIDNGFLNHLTGWFNGDFNYDGVTDGSDYTLIDNAYNSRGAQITSQSADGASVPEPDSGILIALAASGLLGRRSHRDTGLPPLMEA